MNLNIELIEATEAGAIAASKWIGTGDKLAVDEAATTAIRKKLNQIEFSGKIIIGEGIKDNGKSKKYGLLPGERVGKLNDILYDIAIDPVEGTTATVTSGPEAMSVIALAEAGTMYSTPYFYMKKLVYGSEIANNVELNLNDPLEKTIDLVSQATDKKPHQIMVCILDRPRHHNDIQELRKIGVRIKLIRDCDVSGAVSACIEESGIDLLYGIGGSPEGVLTAAAVKCLGGGILVQNMERIKEEFVPKGDVLNLNDLIKGQCKFSATGITTGSLLQGVRWTSKGPVTHSMFMCSQKESLRELHITHGV